jgi:hypothetical protein
VLSEPRKCRHQLINWQTKGLTLEEVNRAFGEKVEVEFEDISDNAMEKVAVVQTEDTKGGLVV